MKIPKKKNIIDINGILKKSAKYLEPNYNEDGDTLCLNCSSARLMSDFTKIEEEYIKKHKEEDITNPHKAAFFCYTLINLIENNENGPIKVRNGNVVVQNVLAHDAAISFAAQIAIDILNPKLFTAKELLETLSCDYLEKKIDIEMMVADFKQLEKS